MRRFSVCVKRHGGKPGSISVRERLPGVELGWDEALQLFIPVDYECETVDGTRLALDHDEALAVFRHVEVPDASGLELERALEEDSWG